ncbi:TlpA family protein disulfide reductase [Ekhidna sp.]|uniref:TlpA family protein disulfide reductase n=1 Tax=Ekhidna sp. TaxID=2608089 RepID=UPI003B509770
MEENPFNDNSVQIGSLLLNENGDFYFDVELSNQAQILIKVDNSKYRTIIAPGDTLSLTLNYVLLEKPDYFGNAGRIEMINYHISNEVTQQVHQVELDVRAIKEKHRKPNGRLSKKYYDEAGAFLVEQFEQTEIQNELASSTFFAFELRNFILNSSSETPTLESLFQQYLVLNFSGIKAVELAYGMPTRIKYISKELNKISYTSFVERETKEIESKKISQALQACLLSSAIGMKWARQESVIASFEDLTENCKDSSLKAYCLSFLEDQRSDLIGQKLKNFQLVNNKGESLSFSDYEGKYLLIDFWATWCGPCIKSMKKLPDLKNSLDGRLEIICVTTEIDEDRVRKFIDKSGLENTLDFALASMQDDEIEAYFNKRAIPLYYLISPDGIVLGKSLADPFPLIKQHLN